VVRGELRLSFGCSPRFDHARGKHSVAINEHAAVFDGDDLKLTPHGLAGLERHGSDVRVARIIGARETT